MRQLLYIACLLYGLSFWADPGSDLDLGWHLLGGHWILDNDTVPRADFINSFNTEWFDYRWLGQIILYGIYKNFGFDGLRIALGLLTAYLAHLMFGICEATSKRSHVITILAFLSAFTLIGNVVSIRPQMIAVVGIAYTYRALLRKPRHGNLISLLIIAILLANIHVYWIFIPVLWGTMRALPTLTRTMRRTTMQSRVHAWGGLLLLFIAGVATPYGTKNYALLFDYLKGSADLKEAIGEFASGMSLPGIAPYFLVGWGALIIRSRILRLAAKQEKEVFPALMALILTIRSLKFISLFGVLGIPSVIRGLKTLAFYRLTRRIQIGSVIAFFILSAAYAAVYFPLNAERSAYLKELPILACRRLAHLDVPKLADRPEIRVLTHFNFGGWCRFSLYEAKPKVDYRVTSDGRTQFVESDQIMRGFDLYRLNYDWAKTLTEWNPDVALVEKNRALAQFMLRAPNYWRKIYEDEKFALFVPVRMASDGGAEER